MRQVLGKEIKQVDSLPRGFAKVVLDVGAGDGKFALRWARRNSDTLVIAADANASQMAAASRTAQREKVLNFLAIQSPAVDLPAELNGSVDQIYVNFPWGSLLEMTMKAAPELVHSFTKVLKPSGQVQFLVTYTELYEPETVRDLGLPQLNDSMWQAWGAEVGSHGFSVSEISSYGRQSFADLCDGKFQTSWYKQISSKRERSVWRVQLVKV